MPYESLPPFVIIAAMLCVAGGVQHVVNKAMYGRPKHPNSDAWDYAMEERDNKIIEEAKLAAAKKS